MRPDIVSTLHSEVHKTVRTICFPLVESRIEFWNVASIQEKFFYLYFLERVKLEEKEQLTYRPSCVQFVPGEREVAEIKRK